MGDETTGPAEHAPESGHQPGRLSRLLLSVLGPAEVQPEAMMDTDSQRQTPDEVAEAVGADGPAGELGASHADGEEPDEQQSPT